MTIKQELWLLPNSLQGKTTVWGLVCLWNDGQVPLRTALASRLFIEKLMEGGLLIAKKIRLGYLKKRKKAKKKRKNEEQRNQIGAVNRSWNI